MVFCGLQVNARLAEEEKERGDGDPFYPKLQWPPPELCPLCRAPLLRGAEAAKPQWNEGEVARFLLKHYVAAPGTKLLRPQAAKKPGHAWGGRCGCLVWCLPVWYAHSLCITVHTCAVHVRFACKCFQQMGLPLLVIVCTMCLL